MEEGTYTHTLAQPVAGPQRARARRMLPLLDAGSLVASFAGALFLLQARGVLDPTHRISHEILVAVAGVALLVFLFRDQQYSSGLRMSRLSDTIAVLKNAALAYGVTLVAAFLTKGFFTGFANYSRTVILGSLALTVVLLFAERVALHAYQSRLFSRGEALRRVAVAGEGQATDELINFIERRPWLGIQCVGRISTSADNSFGANAGARSLPHLGSADTLAEVAEQERVDEVLLALDPSDSEAAVKLLHTSIENGIPCRIVPSLFETSYRHAKLAGFAALPVVDMRVDPLDQVQRTFKRVLDVTVAATALCLMSPVLLASAALVKLSSPGPVLFHQERVGKNGRNFQLLKFRTMYQDAEERLAELEEQNEADGHIFKMKDDPRITPVGRFLRKWSLDEFPQCINVLRGEMSVVGPRPPIPDEVACYETQHHCRLKGMPGITGLWQVSGRSELTFEEMVKLDRYYLENWTLGMDLSIILKTFYVVLARKGAY